jgi:hypothetical protein
MHARRLDALRQHSLAPVLWGGHVTLSARPHAACAVSAEFVSGTTYRFCPVKCGAKSEVARGLPGSSVPFTGPTVLPRILPAAHMTTGGAMRNALG